MRSIITRFKATIQKQKQSKIIISNHNEFAIRFHFVADLRDELHGKIVPLNEMEIESWLCDETKESFAFATFSISSPITQINCSKALFPIQSIGDWSALSSDAGPTWSRNFVWQEHALSHKRKSCPETKQSGNDCRFSLCNKKLILERFLFSFLECEWIINRISSLVLLLYDSLFTTSVRHSMLVSVNIKGSLV
jgi:hypothetical protein